MISSDGPVVRVYSVVYMVTDEMISIRVFQYTLPVIICLMGAFHRYDIDIKIVVC